GPLARLRPPACPPPLPDPARRRRPAPAPAPPPARSARSSAAGGAPRTPHPGRPRAAPARPPARRRAPARQGPPRTPSRSRALPGAAGPRARPADRWRGRGRGSCTRLRQGQEPPEERFAVLRALLRVVLHPEQRLAADHRGDADRAVLRDRLNDALRSLAAVGVREVRPSAGLKRAFAQRLQLLPADVGHLHA